MAGNEALKGWLAIPGVQRGERTLSEQMMGLDAALADCPGKTVIDLGCAEGLIGIEFAKAGAALVQGYELQERFIAMGNEQAIKAGVADRVRLYKADLAFFSGEGEGGPLPETEGADIVLALAIVHKLRQPALALERIAALAKQRLVIRLPIGSRGAFVCKRAPEQSCDTALVLPPLGFRLDAMVDGPRGELVQHWVR